MSDELRRAAERLADSAQAWLDHIDPDEGDENEPHWRDQLAVARAYLATAPGAVARLASACHGLREPIRRYRDHQSWTVGDEELLLKAADEIFAALADIDAGKGGGG